VCFGITLTLNSAVSAISFFCDEVYAYINAIEFWAKFCPFGPKIDFGKPLLVEGVFKEICPYQSFKKSTFAILSIGVLADVIECTVESVICFFTSTSEWEVGLRCF